MNPLVNITSFSIMVPVVTGIIRIKHLHGLLVKVFLIYLIVILVIEAAATVLWSRSMHNIFLYNLGDLATIALLAGSLATFETKYRYVLSIAIGSILTGFFFSEDITVFNRFNYLLIYSAMGVCSGIKLLSLASMTDFIYEEPLFWIYSGMLIYCFSTLNMYLLFDYLSVPGNRMLYTYYKVYNLVVTVLAYSFYTKAFLCRSRTPIY